MTDLFSDSVRGISDFGKSAAQLDYEYAQEMGYVYQYESGIPSLFPSNAAFLLWIGTPYYPGAYTPKSIPGNASAAMGLDVVKLYLAQIRRYNTHEQIMACPDPWFSLQPKGKALSFKETLGPVFHIIAAVVAYVPGFGTAAAFVLNAATSLAEGAPISEATLDAIRGALPGQPVSTMAFDATVALAQGESLDDVAINTAIGVIPVSDDVRGYIKASVRVVRGLADGQPVTSVALDEVYYALPPEGQRTMALAKRAVNGENVGDLAMEEAARAATNAGEDAANAFIADVGYQELMKQVPETIRAAMNAANALAYAALAQSGAPVATYVALGGIEYGANKAINDRLATTGRAIALVSPRTSVGRTNVPDTIKDPEEWQHGFDIGTAVGRGMLSASSDDISAAERRIPSIAGKSGFLAGVKLQVSIATLALTAPKTTVIDTAAIQKANDALASQGKVIASRDTRVRNARDTSTDTAWIRGFDIGTAACAGKAEYDDATTSVLSTLTGNQEAGFLAAESVQFAITKGSPMPALGSILSTARRTQLSSLAARGAQMAAASPVLRAVRSGSPAFLKGFDVATAACAGMTLPGPGQTKTMDDTRTMVVQDGMGLAQDVVQGFTLAQSIQHGIAKTGGGQAAISNDPNVAAGQLAVHGIAGSPISADQKASVVGTAIANGGPGAKAGAAATIAQKKSLWQSFLSLFGL
jgi:hypothetical protein